MAKTIPLLLDTHAWVWLMNGDEDKFSAASRKIIQHAGQRGLLRVSILSVWEVGMLESKGRLKFSRPCLDWINAALSAPGIALAPLEPQAAVESSRLPGSFHGDPVDRMLVATARHLGATLLTQDDKIIRYGKQHSVSVMTLS
ncbi:MAG: type II toxin-antitoxin system VapC family toxin [Pseudomonadota bacterium]